jgi:hypothetical protein
MSTNLILKGNYRAVATPSNTPDGPTWVQFGTAKTGTQQVALTFEILAGQEQGRKITWLGYFSDKTADRTIEALRHCGLVGDDLAAAVRGPLDQEVEIVVDHEIYDGKTRAKVQWVNAGGGGGFKMETPMAKNELGSFAAMMKSRLAKVPLTPGRKAERAPAAPPNGAAPPSGSADPKDELLF